MNYHDSETISIPTVFGNRKEAGLYVYIPPLPTPFLGEWIGLAVKQPEIITAINLSKQSLSLYLDKYSLIKQADIEQLSDVKTLLKESVLLEKQTTPLFYESSKTRSPLLIRRFARSSICG